jgi:hypothetical protein
MRANPINLQVLNDDEIDQVNGGLLPVVPGLIGGTIGAIGGAGSYIASHAFGTGGGDATFGGFMTSTFGGAAAGAIGAYGVPGALAGGVIALGTAGASSAFDNGHLASF